MFDKNYLGHNLIDHPEYNGCRKMTFFICKNCNIFIEFNENAYNNGDGAYSYRYANGWFKEIKKLNVNCNEMIIKGLLE